MRGFVKSVWHLVAQFAIVNVHMLRMRAHAQCRGGGIVVQILWRIGVFRISVADIAGLGPAFFGMAGVAGHVGAGTAVIFPVAAGTTAHGPIALPDIIAMKRFVALAQPAWRVWIIGVTSITRHSGPAALKPLPMASLAAA